MKIEISGLSIRGMENCFIFRSLVDLDGGVSKGQVMSEPQPSQNDPSSATRPREGARLQSERDYRARCRAKSVRHCGRL